MVELETVATGEGWSLVRAPSGTRLQLIVNNMPFLARPGQVVVELPPDFTKEFFQQKRVIRKGALGDDIPNPHG